MPDPAAAESRVLPRSGRRQSGSCTACEHSSCSTTTAAAAAAVSTIKWSSSYSGTCRCGSQDVIITLSKHCQKAIQNCAINVPLDRLARYCTLLPFYMILLRGVCACITVARLCACSSKMLLSNTTRPSFSSSFVITRVRVLSAYSSSRYRMQRIEINVHICCVYYSADESPAQMQIFAHTLHENSYPV